MGWDKKPLPSGQQLLKPYHYRIHSSVSLSALLFHYIVCAFNEITAISQRADRHGTTILVVLQLNFFTICSSSLVQLPLENSGTYSKEENLFVFGNISILVFPNECSLITVIITNAWRCRGTNTSWKGFRSWIHELPMIFLLNYIKISYLSFKNALSEIFN